MTTKAQLTLQLAKNDEFLKCFITKAEENEQHLNDKIERLEDRDFLRYQEIEFLKASIARLTNFSAAGD